MNDESLREQHARLLRIATPCDELAVCHDRPTPCRDCHPVSEGVLSAQRISIALKDIPLSFPRAK